MSIVLKNERLQKLMQKKAKIESDLARLERSAKTEQRKLESRRKIVLGGCLLKAQASGKISENYIENLVNAFASDRDKAIFDFGKSETENGDVNGVASAQRE